MLATAHETEDHETDKPQNRQLMRPIEGRRDQHPTETDRPIVRESTTT